LIYQIIVHEEQTPGRDGMSSMPNRFTLRYSAFLGDDHPVKEKIIWCQQNLPGRPWDWSCFGESRPLDGVMNRVIQYFLFNRADDAMVFKLAWAGEVHEINAKTIREYIGSI
jgi:hypothetical protein